MDENNLIQKKLTGSLNEAEEEKFEAWLAASESNRQAYHQLKALWQTLRPPTAALVVDKDKALKKLWTKAEKLPPVKTPIIKPWYQIAAVILLVVVGGWVVYTNLVQADLVVVSADQRKTVNLPDGSQIWLQQGAEISYTNDFNVENRQLTLDGLAYFEVTENPDLPFTIFCIDGAVTVLGTSFEVKNQSDDIGASVSVFTGKVAVKFGGQEALLIKEQKATYDRASQTLAVDKTSNNELAWKTESINFDQTPIEEAMEVLSEYFHKPFIIEGGQSCQITSRFEKPSLEEVLEELTFLLEAETTINQDTVRIKAADCL